MTDTDATGTEGAKVSAVGIVLDVVFLGIAVGLTWWLSELWVLCTIIGLEYVVLALFMWRIAETTPGHAVMALFVRPVKTKSKSAVETTVDPDATHLAAAHAISERGFAAANRQRDVLDPHAGQRSASNRPASSPLPSPVSGEEAPPREPVPFSPEVRAAQRPAPQNGAQTLPPAAAARHAQRPQPAHGSQHLQGTPRAQPGVQRVEPAQHGQHVQDSRSAEGAQQTQRQQTARQSDPSPHVQHPQTAQPAERAQSAQMPQHAQGAQPRQDPQHVPHAEAGQNAQRVQSTRQTPPPTPQAGQTEQPLQRPEHWQAQAVQPAQPAQIRPEQPPQSQSPQQQQQRSQTEQSQPQQWRPGQQPIQEQKNSEPQQLAPIQVQPDLRAASSPVSPPAPIQSPVSGTTGAQPAHEAPRQHHSAPSPQAQRPPIVPRELILPNGMRVPLAGILVIGRKPRANEGEVPVAIEDDERTISRTHFELQCSGDAVTLRDRASANGTHVQRGGETRKFGDGAELNLTVGDIIRIGRFELRVA